MAHAPHPRNPGIPLDLAWVERAKVNLPALLRRAASHNARRTVKMEWQAAWLLRAVTLIDLTTLDGADTGTNVERLCAKAARPVREDVLEVGLCRPLALLHFFPPPLALLTGCWGC